MVTYKLIPWNYDQNWPAGSEDSGNTVDPNGTETTDAKIDPMSVFTVTVTADGMLTIAKRPSADARMAAEDLAADARGIDNAGTRADEHHYGRGTQFRLKAKDSVTGISVESDPISIARNRRPDTDRGNVDNSGPVTVGEQTGFPATATPTQKLDPCNAMNVVCVNVVDPTGVYDDDDDNNNNDNIRWFHHWNAQYLVYTPTPATGSDGYVSAAMGYDHNDANLDDNPAYLLMVTGLKAGVDATTAKPVVKMAEVEVIATDAGGLETKAGEEAVWVVNVDPAPIVKAGVSPNTRAITTADEIRPATGVSILDNVSRFFEDNMHAALVYSAKIKTNPAER